MSKGKSSKKKIPLAALVSADAFDLKKFGIKADPTKEYRWVDPRRVEERKYDHGYTHVIDDKSPASDRTIRTRGNMVLMERSMDKADESKLRKIARAAQQTSASKEDFEQRIEQASREHGINLHKYISRE